MEKDRKFVNPFTDFGFKRIFAQEINKDIVIDFLNCLLDGERTVANLTFKNPEILPEVEEKRKIIFDVYCESNDGTQFIVEMQALRQDNFLDRALYYESRLVVEQGKKGKEWDYQLNPVYGVYFMDFKMAHSTKFRTDVALCDYKTGKIINHNLRQIFLEMPRFTKEADECKNDFERWLYLIKNMHMLKRMPFNAQRAVWDKLLDIADTSALNAEELKVYEEELKIYRDYHNTMNTARKEGLREGREKGLKEGLREGLKEGMEKGKEAGMKAERIEIAKNLKALGLSSSIIQQSTGLSELEIQSL